MRLVASLLALTLVAPALAAAPAPGKATKGAVQTPRVVLETAEGNITLRLFAEDAPRTTANFLRLVRTGFYDGLTFHRVVPGFVIQGGDPNSRDTDPFNDGQGGPGWTVPGEVKRRHVKGALAMARMPDVVNPKRESNGSQFYIALKDLPALDGGYTVFGEVVSGWDTIDRLVALSDRKDIARTNSDANPGRLALIRRARVDSTATR
ncbi:MAG: peptidylprolyl isomerase [bacterium]